MSKRQCIVEFSKKDLASLDHVIGIISNRVMGGDNILKVSLTDEKLLEFSAFNVGCEMTARFECIAAEGVWAVGTKSRNIGRIMKMRSGAVSIELFDSGLVLRTGDSTFTLPIAEPDQSPYDRMKIGENVGDIFNREVLVNLGNALSRQNSGHCFEFCKIFSESKDHVVKAWAANDRCFMQTTLGATSCVFSSLIHRDILSLLSHYDSGMLYTSGNNGMIFSSNNVVIKFVTGDVKYPDLSTIARMVDQVKQKIMVPAEPFKEALGDVISLNFGEEHIKVRMTINGEKVQLQSHGNNGTVFAEIEITEGENEGDKIDVVFNGGLLSKLVAGFEGGLVFGFSGDTRPIFVGMNTLDLNTLDNYAMIMPMRKEG